MSAVIEYCDVIEKLYQMANPIIKYKIDKEFYRKDDISIEQYMSRHDKLIDYWLNVLNSKKIHGREDCTYENSIAKLLELGFTKNDPEFHELYSGWLGDHHWEEDNSFEGILMKTVVYPFLVRAGYSENRNVSRFFKNRLEKIEKTIEKYGYQFEKESGKVPKKYHGEFIFKLNSSTEALPSIYDLYAYAFYPQKDPEIKNRIEKIVEYILDDRFQQIPDKAYIYDIIKKQYYAVGSVYHACMLESRKLLMIYLLSHFKAVEHSGLFKEEIQNLLLTRSDDGFFELDKSLLGEKKDSYYIYSGSHMGLGEERRRRSWRKIESTFWVLKILYNLEKNNISITIPL